MAATESDLVERMMMAGGGVGAFLVALFGQAFANRKKAKDQAPTENMTVAGALVDSRAARDLAEGLMRLERAIVSSDQDRRSEERDLRDMMRRMVEALDRNTEASRLDLLPESIAGPLRQLDRK